MNKPKPGLQAPRSARSAQANNDHHPYYGPETTPRDSYANAEAREHAKHAMLQPTDGV